MKSTSTSTGGGFILIRGAAFMTRNPFFLSSAPLPMVKSGKSTSKDELHMVGSPKSGDGAMAQARCWVFGIRIPMAQTPFGSGYGGVYHREYISPYDRSGSSNRPNFQNLPFNNDGSWMDVPHQSFEVEPPPPRLPPTQVASL
jgi:hypothetical protein